MVQYSLFSTGHLAVDSAIQAMKGGVIHPGDVIVLICAGPVGSGMEEKPEAGKETLQKR